MGKYQKAAARPRGTALLGIGIAIALVLVSLIVASAQAAEPARRRKPPKPPASGAWPLPRSGACGRPWPSR